MTFRTVDINSITVDRPNRQRSTLVQLNELAQSIKQCGLINPPVVDENNQLIAGERRLEACKLLGWTHIPVQYFSALSDHQRQLVELEENTKRVDLPWPERCKAVLRYHELRAAEQKDWNTTNTAGALGVSQSSVADYLEVARELDKGNAKVASAPKYSTARGIVKRSVHRKKAAETSKILTISRDEEGDARQRYPILNEDFVIWANTKQDQKFNLLHCDFPYGIGVGDNTRAGTFAPAKDFAMYEDSADIYWHLLETLVGQQENFIDESAHLIFWFPMTQYSATVEYLQRGGWDVQAHPLVWLKTTGGGICPDPEHCPTRAYETALFATRGDRHIVRTVRNAIASENTKLVHQAEKPRAMLRHFLRMVVDEYSTVLDPTAGSGNALYVAKELGANLALGLEKDPAIYKEVEEAWNARD